MKNVNLKNAGWIALAVCLVAGGAQAKYTEIKAGLWQITTETKMLGMPAEMPGIVHTTQQCLTQEQLDNQQNLIAVSGTQGNCSIHDVKVTKEWTSWGMTCKKGPMTVEGTGMINPISQTSYKGDVDFSMQSANSNGMALFGKTSIKGKWLSACAKGKAAMQPVFKR